MKKNEVSSKAKAFVESLFSKQEEKRDSNIEIQLELGGQHNFNLFTVYDFKRKRPATYLKELNELSEGRIYLDSQQITTLHNVFVNTEDIIRELFVAYYGCDYFSQDIVETTNLFEDIVISLFDGRISFSYLIGEIEKTSKTHDNNKKFVSKKYNQETQKVEFLLHILSQNSAQSYLEVAIMNLYNDMYTTSQFVHQLGLLAENVAEVLIILHKKFNMSD